MTSLRKSNENFNDGGHTVNVLLTSLWAHSSVRVLEYSTVHKNQKIVRPQLRHLSPGLFLTWQGAKDNKKQTDKNTKEHKQKQQTNKLT